MKKSIEGCVKNYYLIFEKKRANLGALFCVVENEEVAIQFCRDNEDFYNMAREDVL